LIRLAKKSYITLEISYIIHTFEPNHPDTPSWQGLFPEFGTQRTMFGTLSKAFIMTLAGAFGHDGRRMLIAVRRAGVNTADPCRLEATGRMFIQEF